MDGFGGMGKVDEEEYGVDGQWNRGTNGCNVYVAELIVISDLLCFVRVFCCWNFDVLCILG